MRDQWAIDQFKQGKAVSLYIVEAQQYITDQKLLVDWCWNLFNQIYETKRDWSNHQDILFLDHAEDKLKNNNIQEVFNFLKTRPCELKQKYIIISNATGLSHLAQNKLLKVWEEPPVPASFLLLNPNRIQLLDTVLSRAQKLKAVIDLPELAIANPSSITESTLTTFQGDYKNNWTKIRNLIEALCHHVPNDARACQELSEIYQNYVQDITYHNNSSYLTYKLYRFAQKWLNA